MRLEACRRLEAKQRLFRLRESEIVSSNHLKGWQKMPDLIIRIVRERTRFQAQLQKASFNPPLRIDTPAPELYPFDALAKGVESLTERFPGR